MSDVKIAYGSTGFERVNQELESLEKTGSGAHAWFRPLQTSLKDAEAAGESFVSKFKSGFESVGPVINGVVNELGKVVLGITAVAGVVGGAATAAFAFWSKSVLSTTESFRMLETSLYGATKSWESVNKVSQFAKEYAAEYPAMYKDVMQTMQSMAFIPSLKPMIEKGDVNTMKDLMGIIQGLAVMRPEQGVQGAMMALREALGGQWRSLQFRFDIQPETFAKTAGMSLQQMQSSPQKTIEAFKNFTDQMVGADTMAMAAKNLSIQVGNLKDKYEMWLDKLGKTGIYDKVVGYVLNLNEAFDNLLKSEKFQKITEQLNVFLEGIAAGIAKIFTKGVDWESVADLKSLLEVFRKVGQNSMEALREAWEAAKEPVSEALKSVLTFGAEVAIDAAKDLFFPVGKSIASGIAEGVKEGMKEHPVETMVMGAAAGAYMGKSFGPKGALMGAVLGAEAAALPSQIEAVKALWQNYSDFMEATAGKIENAVRRMVGMPAKEQKQEWPSEARFIQRWKPIETEQEWPSEARFVSLWRNRPQPLEPWHPGAEEKFSQYSMWSRMARMLAQAPEEAPKTARYLFATGAIPYEEFKKQQRFEDFRSQQMGKLEEILAMPAAGPETKTKVFGEMFTVSMGKGDYGKAQDYMNRALESMAEQVKQEAGIVKEQLKAAMDTAANSGQILQEIRNGKALFTDRPPEERAAIAQAARGTTLKLTGGDWSEDELQFQVRNALKE